MIHILLADDHVLFREGLAALLSAQPDFEIVDQASDGCEAVSKSLLLLPDLVLMDVDMPVCGGLEAARLISSQSPDTVVIMLADHAEDQNLFQAIRNGAQGYLLKGMRSVEIVKMIREAMSGAAALNSHQAGRLLQEFRRLSGGCSGSEDDSFELLTRREVAILTIVAEGATNKEIASKFSLSLHTVKSHIRKILMKLQVNNRRQAARFARRKGLI
jgi:DNA-binding NarL/FixJ family response regulator